MYGIYNTKITIQIMDATNPVFKKINDDAVAKMKASKTIEDVDKAMQTVFDEAEKVLGRPMTYAEMRMRFG